MRARPRAARRPPTRRPRGRSADGRQRPRPPRSRTAARGARRARRSSRSAARASARARPTRRPRGRARACASASPSWFEPPTTRRRGRRAPCTRRARHRAAATSARRRPRACRAARRARARRRPRAGARRPSRCSSTQHSSSPGCENAEVAPRRRATGRPLLKLGSGSHAQAPRRPSPPLTARGALPGATGRRFAADGADSEARLRFMRRPERPAYAQSPRRRRSACRQMMYTYSVRKWGRSAEHSRAPRAA